MNKPSLSSDRAVCVWIPLFALRAEEQRRPELIGRPAAIMAPDDTRRIWQVSPVARRSGVRPQMTVSQAIGLCPSLTILSADPVHYDDCFSSMVLAVNTVSPVVEPAELGRMLVGVDGLERLHGGPMRQLRIIADAIDRTTATGTWTGLRLGYARGKFAAWVAASRARPNAPVVVEDAERLDFLRAQPLAALPITSDTHRRLWQLGLRTLGDLITLPADAVTSQFGREGTLAWQLAAGRITEPVTGTPPPEPVCQSVDFANPVADRQLLTAAMRRLVERALQHPRRRGWRIHVVRARAVLEHGRSWQVTVTLRDPSAFVPHIANPLKARLDAAPPSGGVERLTVEFLAFVPGTRELQLFAQDAASAARAGRQRALRWAAREIKTRLQQSLLHHVIEVHPWSRIPERRYALIDFDP